MIRAALDTAACFQKRFVPKGEGQFAEPHEVDPTIEELAAQTAALEYLRLEFKKESAKLKKEDAGGDDSGSSGKRQEPGV